jgi:D-arabinose 1-dehydrogenase-like Zn-dependent alcohol dehydrogenase
MSSSDIHFWKVGSIGPLIVGGDCILGHEAAGIVLKIGEGVTSLKEGSFFPHIYSPCPLLAVH